MAQCADYPDDIPIAEALMRAEHDERRAFYTAIADELQSHLPDPAPQWALRILLRWRIAACR